MNELTNGESEMLRHKKSPEATSGLFLCKNDSIYQAVSNS